LTISIQLEVQSRLGLFHIGLSALLLHHSVVMLCDRLHLHFAKLVRELFRALLLFLLLVIDLVRDQVCAFLDRNSRLNGLLNNFTARLVTSGLRALLILRLFIGLLSTDVACGANHSLLERLNALAIL